MFSRLKVEFLNRVPFYDGYTGLLPVARVDEHARFHYKFSAPPMALR
jgi:hypothetical protein